jgi:hypothetical protein
MVCPLRYVVAGVSVLLALFVLLWTEWDRRREVKTANVVHEDVKTTKLKKGDKTTTHSRFPENMESFVSTIISFFNGRYLLDQWRAFRNSNEQTVS